MCATIFLLQLFYCYSLFIALSKCSVNFFVSLLSLRCSSNVFLKSHFSSSVCLFVVLFLCISTSLRSVGLCLFLLGLLLLVAARQMPSTRFTMHFVEWKLSGSSLVLCIEYRYHVKKFVVFFLHRLLHRIVRLHTVILTKDNISAPNAYTKRQMNQLSLKWRIRTAV